jgi:hypothetical protein
MQAQEWAKQAQERAKQAQERAKQAQASHLLPYPGLLLHREIHYDRRRHGSLSDNTRFVSNFRCSRRRLPLP